MRYSEWEAAVPAAVRSDPLWGREVYRLALYVADLAWDDARRLTAARASAAAGDHLCAALGALGGAIASAERRRTAAERARHHAEALGLVRDSRESYRRARPVLGAALVSHRVRVLGSIARRLAGGEPALRLTRPPTPPSAAR